jgi:hypothetical protein
MLFKSHGRVAGAGFRCGAAERARWRADMNGDVAPVEGFVRLADLLIPGGTEAIEDFRD